MKRIIRFEERDEFARVIASLEVLPYDGPGHYLMVDNHPIHSADPCDQVVFRALYSQELSGGYAEDVAAELYARHKPKPKRKRRLRAKTS